MSYVAYIHIILCVFVIILEKSFIIKMELLCQILIDNVKFTYEIALPSCVSTKSLESVFCTPVNTVYYLSLKFAKVMDEIHGFFFLSVFAITCFSGLQMNLDILSLLYSLFVFLLCKPNMSFPFFLKHGGGCGGYIQPRQNCIDIHFYVYM